MALTASDRSARKHFELVWNMLTMLTALTEGARDLLLILLGISAGLFSVPVQVYLQAKAPADQKGRIIGVMNLFNWIGIAAAGPFYKICISFLGQYKAPNLLFAAAAIAVVPLLIFYHPRDEQLA